MTAIADLLDPAEREPLAVRYANSPNSSTSCGRSPNSDHQTRRRPWRRSAPQQPQGTRYDRGACPGQPRPHRSDHSR
jgi:hypothetical protein